MNVSDVLSEAVKSEKQVKIWWTGGKTLSGQVTDMNGDYITIKDKDKTIYTQKESLGIISGLASKIDTVYMFDQPEEPKEPEKKPWWRFWE
jgi:hypothetical protein